MKNNNMLWVAGTFVVIALFLFCYRPAGREYMTNPDSKNEDKDKQVVGDDSAAADPKGHEAKPKEGAVFEGKVQMSQLDLKIDDESESIKTERDSDISSKSLGTIYGVVTGDLPRSHDSIHDIVSAVEEGKNVGPLPDASISAECIGIGKRKTTTDDSGYYKLADLEETV